MKLHISINARKIEGPYGGGNQFANTLERYLTDRGHKVFRKLVSELDLILIVSSQKDLKITAYDIDDVMDYISLSHGTIVVHRVNSCDEQRGSNLGINEATLKMNQTAGYTIFISSFLKNLFCKNGMDTKKPNRVILNGADEDVFHPQGQSQWDSSKKLSILTHHWSSNYMKGFDIYERLDQLLEFKPFKALFEFTYIGNIPMGVSFKNSKVIPPTSGIALAGHLRKHHIYLTAARNEAGGMHHIEGMRCGLPVLYLRSGALPEYCAPYGIGFTLTNFEEKLLEMYKAYPQLKEKVNKCPYTGTWMAAQYEKVFLQLFRNRQSNMYPKPGLIKKMKLFVITRPYRKIRKFRRLLKKAKKFLQ
jgi:glycosyltransferase involved in cell wall biosynthesis